MYKTAVLTDEISQDIVVAAKLARQYGLDALEIRSVNERNPFQMTKDDVSLVKSVCDEYGLPICGIGSPLFKIQFDDKKAVSEHLSAFERLCDTAHFWGASLIRGFAFFSFPDAEARMNEIAQTFQQAVDIATRERITILIEAEPVVVTRNIESQIAFIKRIDSPYVQALYDPGNEIADLCAPPPYPDGYGKLRPYIRHVHLKDLKRNSAGPLPAMLGEGDVDFHGILNALKHDGYDGYVSVETHYRISAALDEHSLVYPQGSGFSQGGYEATCAYLDKLRDEYKWMEALS